MSWPVFYSPRGTFTECSVTFGMRKNNAFCKVHLVGCIQHDNDKLVVLELLSSAHEVQDQWWIPKIRRISDHAAFQVRPCVHLSFTNCKRLKNLKIKTYLAFSIVEVVRSVVRSLGKCANISYLILYFVFAQVPLHYTHVGWSKLYIDRLLAVMIGWRSCHNSCFKKPISIRNFDSPFEPMTYLLSQDSDGIHNKDDAKNNGNCFKIQ